MCKAETMPDTYFGALRNIWFDERILFNNNFPSLNHGDGINIHESVNSWNRLLFSLYLLLSFWSLIDRKLQGFFCLFLWFGACVDFGNSKWKTLKNKSQKVLLQLSVWLVILLLVELRIQHTIQFVESCLLIFKLNDWGLDTNISESKCLLISWFKQSFWMPSPNTGGLEKLESKNAKYPVGFWKRPSFVTSANLKWLRENTTRCEWSSFADRRALGDFWSFFQMLFLFLNFAQWEWNGYELRWN